MKITRHTDLSLRLLMYLALQPGETVSVAEVSRSFRVSRNHLGKIVSELAELGYVRTMRGKGGGMRLVDEPATIRLGDLVSRMEPSSELFDCHNPRCPITDNCEFKRALDVASESFLAALNRFTVADMTRNEARLTTLLGIATPGR